MAQFKILGKNGSNYSFFADSDTATIPGTITTNTGQQLTIASASGALISSSDIQLASGKGISTAGGAGNFDFSGSSGTTKTTTGAVTVGPGAITVSGNATMQAGTTLATTGSGNINLPNNGSARFQIEGAAVSANVTATNLGTLTGGGNADALHTHTAVQATALDLPGQTLWATPATGEVGYISSNNTLAKAKADSANTLAAIGAYAGTASTVLISGKMSLLFEPGLTLAAGDRVYLSAATAGRVTNVAPSTATQFEYWLGMLLDATGYSSGAGSAQPCVWQPKIPIQIA